MAPPAPAANPSAHAAFSATHACGPAAPVGQEAEAEEVDAPLSPNAESSEPAFAAPGPGGGNAEDVFESSSSSSGLESSGLTCWADEPAAAKAPAVAAAGPPLFMYLMAGCAALNSTNIGFDIGVSSGVARLLQADWQITDAQVGIFMGSIHFMAALGGLCSQSISDRLGRRLTFAVAQGTLLVGLAIAAAAGSFEVLMLGRAILGLAVGFGLAIDPLYIAELAPAAHRGRLTSWPDIAINLGILLGFFVNWLFAGIDAATSWRLMLACGSILPLVLLVLSLSVMPESPRWLVGRGNVQAAASVLASTHPEGENVGAVVQAIVSEIQEDAARQSLGWAPLLCPDKVTRKMLLVGVGVAFAQQVNGSESVVAYSPTIFERAGVATTEESLFAVTMLVGLSKTAFIFVAAHYVDTAGRRPLLIMSTVGMTLCLACLSLAMALDIGWLAVVGVCSFVAAFSLGIGPIAFLLAAEVFPSQIRAKAISLAAFVNRCTSGAVTGTFLPLSSAVGGQAQYFGLFAVLTGLTALGAYLVVPETKQRTLEQLRQGMEKPTGDKNP